MTLLRFNRPLLRPTQFTIASFAGAIVLGALLLMLPGASRQEPLSAIDALFTATSAVCVTGLIVVDTGTHFTGFGQAVILGLIQVGGLGIVTFSTLIFYRLTGRTSLRDRETVLETVGGSYPVQMSGFLRRILVVTLSVESVGAAVLAARFSDSYPLQQALYLGAFHAVSAFCNAGFSLFPDSLVSFQGDPVINATVMALIVTGGLGFPVLLELGRAVKQRWRFRRLSLHSKLVLLVSASLIVAGSVAFYLSERNNSLAGLSPTSRLLVSVFQSVTARTAGFNTIDTGGLSEVTLFLMAMLMFVGGGSGSCAGGIKVTSFCVLAALAWRHLHGRDDANLFGRRIPEAIVNRVTAIVGMSLLLTAGILVLLLATQDLTATYGGRPGTFLDLLFETISAFGTVGLSTGVTPDLNAAGRILITFLMFAGRVGTLSLVALVQLQRPAVLRYPEEHVMVG